ncbi:saccharopine dehydrogenase family protein [Falsihalocynthiibacter arcticus]|uniref:Saccharopine dehydrogenase n=1 Tax=Falsihalocynthiibacter arcticus TaxID=1579316 RepID=A0A126UXG6_9RHOB|nr:saccharopine dehydrogenase family protein [Falsihalocynthiibacter arcticus]AML50758.1 saccharopine dehydrogenase [Falsihalocynthiibacter arcticus]
MTIHWCGTGLSSVPGLRRILEAGHDVTVWNRTFEEADQAVGDLTQNIKIFAFDALQADLKAGDIAVSMLPTDFHLPVAKICLAENAHFVCSSYISPEMAALDSEARAKGLCLVSEVGLDPGIDHLMAHHLVADYRASDAYDVNNVISFKSFCGGVPKISNAFRYKFSWSPIGVLKALIAPSRSIRNFTPLNMTHSWDAIRNYVAPLPTPETFEVYPNRDSLPFMEEYHFDEHWKVKEFERGTLRLNGWADAWADVFNEIGSVSGPEGDERLQEMSDQMWRDHAYEKDEPDRTVMCVDFKAERDGIPIYHKTYVLDAWGDARGSAMSRLVSVTMTLAIESILNRELPVGVSAAPKDLKLVENWMTAIEPQAQFLALKSAL